MNINYSKINPHVITFMSSLVIYYLGSKLLKKSKIIEKNKDAMIRNIQQKVFNVKVTYMNKDKIKPNILPWLCPTYRTTIKHKKKRSLGTGFLIGSDILVTNYHVIDKWKDKTATTKVYDASFHKYEGKVLKVYPKKDIAFVKIINFNTNEPLSCNLHQDYYIGDSIMAITFDQEDKVHHVTFGNITEYYQENRLWWIQSSILVAPGFSGSPLLNMKGEVIGVNTSSHDDHNTLSQAIAISQVIELYKKDIVPLLED